MVAQGFINLKYIPLEYNLSDFFEYKSELSGLLQNINQTIIELLQLWIIVWSNQQ